MPLDGHALKHVPEGEGGGKDSTRERECSTQTICVVAVRKAVTMGYRGENTSSRPPAHPSPSSDAPPEEGGRADVPVADHQAGAVALEHGEEAHVLVPPPKV